MKRKQGNRWRGGRQVARRQKKETEEREDKALALAKRRWKKWLRVFGRYGQPCPLGRNLVARTLLRR